MQSNRPDLDNLFHLCNLPTAPYHEQYVAAFVRHWASQPERRLLRVQADPWGNLYVRYRQGKSSRRTLFLEAHMDHPGFIVIGTRRDGTLNAAFLGGVKPSCFEGGRIILWRPDRRAAGLLTADGTPAGRWTVARVLAVKPQPGGKPLRCVLASPGEKVSPGTIGMWNLPDAAAVGNLLAARACDDVAGVAVGLAVLDRLIKQRSAANVTLLLTRAEEVGFIGAIAAAKSRRFPSPCSIIGIETSKTLPHARQGDGPIIRVGDRTTIFSPSLTRFIHQTAAGLADDEPGLHYQRQLMDGGTCDTTAFGALGFDSGAVCLALGNYHNMREHSTGTAAGIAPASKHIASETIDRRDFVGLVEMLTAVCRRFSQYRPADPTLRRRFLRQFSSAAPRLRLGL